MLFVEFLDQALLLGHREVYYNWSERVFTQKLRSFFRLRA